MDRPQGLPNGDEDLQVSIDGGALRLTLTRPERLNALTMPMVTTLCEALERAVAVDEVRCVVLAGAGGSFCAGADIGDTAGLPDGHSVEAANRLVRAVTALDKPVLAAVDGVAAGVGCSLALACDLVVATRRSSFLLAFTRVGLMPDGGSSWTAAAAVGRARAMRMALLAEPLGAEEAYAAGLVSHLAEDDLTAPVEELVARLASGPPLALAATKKAVNAATLGGLPDALERERRGQTVLLGTEDAAEGVQAFRDRRRADFRGR